MPFRKGICQSRAKIIYFLGGIAIVLIELIELEFKMLRTDCSQDGVGQGPLVLFLCCDCFLNVPIYGFDSATYLNICLA